jgi:hypothetical protein
MQTSGSSGFGYAIVPLAGCAATRRREQISVQQLVSFAFLDLFSAPGNGRA